MQQWIFHTQCLFSISVHIDVYINMGVLLNCSRYIHLPEHTLLNNGKLQCIWSWWKLNRSRKKNSKTIYGESVIKRVWLSTINFEENIMAGNRVTKQKKEAHRDNLTDILTVSLIDIDNWIHGEESFCQVKERK